VTVDSVAAIICASPLPHPVRVAVDGISAAGKSTFAAELTDALAARRRPTVHLTLDGYHHPRDHRYRRGRHSAVGYYDDAFDFAAFARHVLVPLGPGGDRRYRMRVHDLESDEQVDEPALEAPVDAVVVVDGSFLQRPELAPHWDWRIFVNTSPAVARARGLRRDAAALGGRRKAETLYDTRYHAAADLYRRAVSPEEHADLVLDNDDLAHPVLVVRRR
jgi:uridine kinase